MSWMVKIEHVSKMYRLGLVGSATIQDDLKRVWYKWRGKEDPFLKIGEENKRDAVGGNYVWALKDIDLEVNQGEVLGIIGKNGAGKSTLLKLLSKVTKPSTGSIKTRGRNASLLEVGTGFHPELTGRENIFLNGAILGMKKHEIKSKFDEIVEFSGCERYIDTPVKRYSSGMYVRLAFAVAAHLDPEILVVDEVLAVGDAEFQKKAIGKMKDVSEGQGRTVLFVSHNMNSIRNLCGSALILDKGIITFKGSVNEGISNYLSTESNQTKKNIKIFKLKNQLAYVKKIKILNSKHGFIDFIDDYVKVLFDICIIEHSIHFFLAVKIEDSQGNIIIQSSSNEKEDDVFQNLKNPHDCHVEVSIPGKILKPGKYFLGFSLREHSKTCA